VSLVEPLKRAAIIVRDLDRSLAFYRDALGLGVWVEGECGRDNAQFAQLLGLPPGATRFVILRSGEATLGMVGLFEVREPDLDAVSIAEPEHVHRGEVALVFHTDDIQAVHAKVQALGLKVVCAPLHLEMPSINVNSLEMTFRDPNGVLINCIQRLAAPARSS
jgi:catechol 2,3-dioxygenase-like lactoylglutathione lyase family enzyme